LAIANADEILGIQVADAMIMSLQIWDQAMLVAALPT